MITNVRYRPPSKTSSVVGAGVGAGIGSGDGKAVGRGTGSGDGSGVGGVVGTAVGENVATLAARTEMSAMPRRRRPVAPATIELSKEPSEIAAETSSFTCASGLACASSSTERGSVSSVAMDTSGVEPFVPALSQRCSSNDAPGSVSSSAGP